MEILGVDGTDFVMMGWLWNIWNPTLLIHLNFVTLLRRFETIFFDS